MGTPDSRGNEHRIFRWCLQQPPSPNPPPPSWSPPPLRARTPAEKTDPPDWARIDTLAWVKHRASRSLAEYLGVPDTFRPDGSWQHQIDEALKYERLLVETVGGGR